MPYKVRKKGREWLILKGKKTVGHSKTKRNAQASVRARGMRAKK